MGVEKIFKIAAVMTLIDKFSGPAKGIGDSTDENIKKLDEWQNKFNDLGKSGATVAGLGAGITVATTNLAKSTFETSRALGELKSLGIENLEALENAGTNFSNTWAGTTKPEFITAAYDIKSGIASLTDEGVAGYTEVAGITAKATKATVGQMTDLFATGYGIYKDFYSDMSDIEFAEMFGAGIARSVQAFKTDGAKMAQSISTLGASATSAQVPLEEQLSVLGMLQATMGGSEAGTKYKAFLKSAAKAGDTMGLSFLDANNQLKAMPDIIGELHNKFGETMDAAEKMQLTEAFGTEEAVAVIDLLYNKTGEMNDNIDLLYSSMGEGKGLITDMANAINDTDYSQYELFHQELGNLMEDLGKLVLPVFMKMISAGSSAVSMISEWAKKHEKLTSVFIIAATAFGFLLTGLGIGMVLLSALGTTIISLVRTVTALKKGVSTLSKVMKVVRPIAIGIRSTFKAMGIQALTAGKNAAIGMATMAKQAIVTAARALPGLIASTWAWTAALLANPVTWIVLGIVALIAVIVLLYKNWDKVTAFMKAAWSGFCNAIGIGISWVKNGFTAVVNFITGKLEWFRTAGSKIITTLVSGIKSMASKPVEAIKSIFLKVRKFLPFSDAKEGPLSDLTLSGSRVLTTMVTGMRQVENLPAEETEKAFQGVSKATARTTKKVDITRSTSKETTTEKDTGRKTVIQKLVLNVDISKIKDLQSIIKLVDELNDFDNGADSDSTEIEFA